MQDKELLKKEEIFLFNKKHGLKATFRFKISRSTFYSFKKKLKNNKEDIRCLKNRSIRPKNVRKREYCHQLIDEMIHLRTECGRKR